MKKDIPSSQCTRCKKLVNWPQVNLHSWKLQLHRGDKPSEDWTVSFGGPPICGECRQSLYTVMHQAAAAWRLGERKTTESSGLDLKKLTLDDIINAMRIHGFRAITIDKSTDMSPESKYTATTEEWYGAIIRHIDINS